MFAGIAPRYDLLNRVLSVGTDVSWRRRACRELGLRAPARILDACTGTGDLAFEWARVAEGRALRVVGADFTREMLRIAEAKRRRRGADRLSLVAADTLRLPFADGSFDGATVAFGIRNVSDLPAALRELRRVLRPGGRLGILEFSRARARWMRPLFGVYFRFVLPFIGRVLSYSATGGEAYAYLPRSVGHFPTPQALSEELREAGFVQVRFVPFTGGVAVLHVASRPEPEPPGAAP
jgi:demethylmenaquinone methyltransferase/2-methoxy-6-polyprenyl-1,4-benzoquinol methylase